jgi:hypothetical protein
LFCCCKSSKVFDNTKFFEKTFLFEKRVYFCGSQLKNQNRVMGKMVFELIAVSILKVPIWQKLLRLKNKGFLKKN